jgi:hypothetical protein
MPIEAFCSPGKRLLAVVRHLILLFLQARCKRKAGQTAIFIIMARKPVMMDIAGDELAMHGQAQEAVYPG